MQEEMNDNSNNEEALQKEESENMKNENAAADSGATGNREVEIILELETKLKAAEQEIGELKDKFIRKSAEFENYKRRTEQEQINLIKYGGEQLAMRLLPVVDDYDRASLHLKDNTDTQKVIHGLTLILEKFIKTLNDQGIKKFESAGKPFDVGFHDAMLQQVSAEHPANTVLQEVLAGYMYKDKVIRHAQVIVSSEPEVQATESGESKE